MDLLLPSDAAPLTWDAPTQDEAHTWRGTMEANALREFLADTDWGELDVLLLDLPPGTDRLLTVASLVPVLAGMVVVTIPSDVSQLVVRRSITVAAQGAGARCWAWSRTWPACSRARTPRRSRARPASRSSGRVPFDRAWRSPPTAASAFVARTPTARPPRRSARSRQHPRGLGYVPLRSAPDGRRRAI